jgi:hypothetical protein
MCVICILCGIALAAGAVSAAPSTEPEPLNTTPDGVTVDTGPLSVPSDGSFAIDVAVEVPEPTSYLEVRLQIHRPSGRLLFQRTEVRSNVETGTVEVGFGRELADLELRPDAYPYEIRVRTQADEVVEKVATGFLLVHEPDPEITPVALAVRISSTPRFDPQGNLVSDPSRSTGALEQAEALARAVLDDPTLRLSLAISPVTLDEWSRVSQGFMLAETDEGLVEVSASEPGPVRYAAALETLRDALATGRLELLDVPYADPDVAALAATGRLDDLGAHYALGLSTYVAALETTPSAGTAVAGDALPTSAFETLEERDIRFAIIAPHLPAEDGGAEEADVPGGGVYSVEGSTVDAVVLSSAIGEALDKGAASAAALLAFRHAISEDAAMPVITLTDLGPGRTGSVQSVVELARLMNEAAWARLVSATQAAETPSSVTYEPPASLEVTPTPPAGYWEDVAGARRYAAAHEFAAGADDPDARLTNEASLVAQSARWAGADGRWSMADRGRAFASTAQRISHSILDTVSLTTKDVTLAGPRGEVPISIVNGSAKDLQVVLRVRADDMIVTGESEYVVTLRPQENFHTVAVDLRSLLADTLVVELWADDVMLASGTSVVRASFLDRLALVAGAVAILLGLLFYIRKRVRAADAGNMPSQTDQTSGEGTTS